MQKNNKTINKSQAKWKEPSSQNWWIIPYLAAPSVGIGMAKSGEEDLNPNLAGLRRRHLHILNHQWLIRFPRHRRCSPFPNQTLISETQRKIPQNQNQNKNKQIREINSDLLLLQIPLQVMTWPWVAIDGDLQALRRRQGLDCALETVKEKGFMEEWLWINSFNFLFI